MSDIVEFSAVKILSEELTTLADRIRENHLRAGQKASGRTAQSIVAQVVHENGSIVGKVLGRHPFATLETGSCPFGSSNYEKIPLDRPFAEIIRDWMRAKGIKVRPMPYKTDRAHKYSPEERAEMSAANAIAFTIMNEGSKLFRTNGRADIYSNEIPTALERISLRAGDMMREEVTKMIKLNTK